MIFRHQSLITLPPPPLSLLTAALAAHGYRPPFELRASWTIDNCRTWLYHSYMNHAIGSALVQAAHRVESRLEEALAGVGLSIAKFETLSVMIQPTGGLSARK